MNGGVAIAAVIAVKRRRIINTFKTLSATSPKAAIMPEEHRIRKGFIFRRLRNFGVLIEAGQGYYYLDEVAERELTKQRRKIVLVLMVIIIAVMCIAFWASK